MFGLSRKGLLIALGVAFGALAGSASLHVASAGIEEGTWKWEDANRACPLACDSGKYSCPCWQAL